MKNEINSEYWKQTFIDRMQPEEKPKLHDKYTFWKPGPTEVVLIRYLPHNLNDEQIKCPICEKGYKSSTKRWKLTQRMQHMKNKIKNEK